MCVAIVACAPAQQDAWILVDDFETRSDAEVRIENGARIENDARVKGWTHADVQNETKPFVPDPQIAEVRSEAKTDNQYLLIKPAADGIVGNRKALGFKALPEEIPVGATYTIYTRINVEAFPNNHSFGLSNLPAPEILTENYNAFEPMIRVTDKAEPGGTRNDGTLMALSGYKTYSKIQNPNTGQPAKPLKPGAWYEVWAVVNNAPQDAGGQTYDLHVRGGEFETQQQVFNDAVFRMNREAPLKFFMTICNTGPHKSPYGNGGVRYDDIYMTQGETLSSP